MRVTTRSGLLVRACIGRCSNNRDMGRWGGNCVCPERSEPWRVDLHGRTRLPEPVLLPRHPPGDRCRSDDVAVRRPRHRPLLGTTAVSRARRSTSASGTACTRAARAATARARSCTTNWISIRRSRSVLAAASASVRRITAYTSPNNMFQSVKELSFKFSKAHMLAPYGVLAFELGGDESGQADGGQFIGGSPGTYLELGVGPSWPLGDGVATLAVPVKMGLSLGDYYERLDENGVLTDDGFGFFDIGGLVTFPLSKVCEQLRGVELPCGPGLPHARRHEPGAERGREHQGRLPVRHRPHVLTRAVRSRQTSAGRGPESVTVLRAAARLDTACRVAARLRILAFGGTGDLKTLYHTGGPHRAGRCPEGLLATRADEPAESRASGVGVRCAGGPCRPSRGGPRRNCAPRPSGARAGASR